MVEVPANRLFHRGPAGPVHRVAAAAAAVSLSHVIRRSRRCRQSYVAAARHCRPSSAHGGGAAASVSGRLGPMLQQVGFLGRLAGGFFLFVAEVRVLRRRRQDPDGKAKKETEQKVIHPDHNFSLIC